MTDVEDLKSKITDSSKSRNYCSTRIWSNT